MKLLPCGDRAVLAEFADAAERRRAYAALVSLDLPGCTDIVPAAVTILLRFRTPEQLAAARARVSASSLDAVPAPTPADLLTIAVRYDGPDLGDVAAGLGWSTERLVAWHTGQVWTVDFVGFLPGFGYLIGNPGNPDVPRRATPRTRIPAGAVGLAGTFAGIYPHPSPGGWQLIGTTTAALWDPAADPPALLRPGRRVRFEAVSGE